MKRRNKTIILTFVYLEIFGFPLKKYVHILFILFISFFIYLFTGNRPFACPRYVHHVLYIFQAGRYSFIGPCKNAVKAVHKAAFPNETTLNTYLNSTTFVTRDFFPLFLPTFRFHDRLFVFYYVWGRILRGYKRIVSCRHDVVFFPCHLKRNYLSKFISWTESIWYPFKYFVSNVNVSDLSFFLV